MYEHGGDLLRDELDRVELILDRAVEASGGDGISAARIDAFTGVGETDDSTAAEIERLAAVIEENAEASRAEGVSLRLHTLARAVDLSRADRDALLFVLAPEIDRSITRRYGQIAAGSSAMLPSVDLVETLLSVAGHGSADGERLHESLADSSPLFEYGILERTTQQSGQPANYDLLSVDERIVCYLKGGDSLDATLAEIVEIERQDRTLSELVFDEETSESLEAIRARTSSRETPTLCYFAGEAGTGPDRLPGALADGPILRTHAGDIFEDDRLTRLFREARLRGAAIHIEDLGAVTESERTADPREEQERPADQRSETPSIDDIVERLDDAPGDVFVSHTEPWTPDVDLSTHHLETCECPFPEHAVRRAIWAEYAAEFAEEDLVDHIATNFRLPQHDIRRAVRTARYLCRTDDEQTAGATAGESDDGFAPIDGELTRAHLYEACKRYSANNLESLAEQLDPGYTWDDIALNDRQEAHLKELCGHLQYRGAVTNEWGFGEPGSRGDGVVALFYGQPGTGKTMAAEIIANETGLDLYRVDLSQIINKYVGETESRLATLLDEAERSNAVLLFDEADAIFGKRAEVKDATDRYANTEINFLLQRLESFDGILLLTTNKRAGIDSAFKRRIQHSIGFEKPQELIRRELWQDVFPDEANVETEGFDYEFLGRITTTPALIRKVAKYAAYIAATEAHEGRPLEDSAADLSDVTITFDHVIRALQYAREAGGAGFQVDFGEYEDRRRSYESRGVSRDWREELKRANEQTTIDVRDEPTERDPDSQDR
jgi:SpoVK/Ycf46/Vps4 family AAA+-type ATPase